VDIKKKVVLIAACAELVAMGALWFGRKKPAAKQVVASKPPAAAVAPAPHRVSPFSSHPFSADITIVTRTAKFHHIQQNPPAASGGDLTVSYHGKMYAGRDACADLLSSLRDPNAKVNKQDLGPETVGSYPCEKYKVDVTGGGHTLSGWIWVAKAKDLDGFIVKSQDAASKQSVTLSDVQLKTPVASLFDLPPGYQKFTEAPQQTAPVRH
jgi:hypothetical protein